MRVLTKPRRELAQHIGELEYISALNYESLPYRVMVVPGAFQVLLINDSLTVPEHVPLLNLQADKVKFGAGQMGVVTSSCSNLPERRAIVNALEYVSLPAGAIGIRKLVEQRFVQPLECADKARELILDQLADGICGHLWIRRRD